MTLDSANQRHDLIEEMIEKTIEYEEILSEYDDGFDCCGAKVAFDFLIAIERLVSAEEIFLETYGKLRDTPHPDDDEKTRLLEIFSTEGVQVFVSGILLDRLEYLLKTLDDWDFRTEDGKDFREYISERLESLIDAYENYDVAAQEVHAANLESNLNKIKLVTKLYERAKEIDDDFRKKEKTNPVSFGDLFGLMVMMEKLTALRDLLVTEKILENAGDAPHKLEGLSESVIDEFVFIFKGQRYMFVKMVLAQRLRSMANFANNKFEDERLMEFQKDFREIMEELLDFYVKTYDL